MKICFLILFITFYNHSFIHLRKTVGKTKNEKKKKLIVVTALVLCLGVLFVFKYLNFFFAVINDVVSAFALSPHPITLNLILPVGISFYTFQTLSYVIDVYRGDVAVEKHFEIYAAFVSFFPLSDYGFKTGEQPEQKEDTKLFEIKTDVVSLYYPEKWKDKVDVKVNGKTVSFMNNGDKVFDLRFENCDGYLLGTYKNTPIYIVEYKAKNDDQVAMQQDVNVIINNLSKDKNFIIN